MRSGILDVTSWLTGRSVAEPRILPDGDDGDTPAQAIVDTVREPLLVLDKDLRVVTASRSFYAMFHVNSRDTLGRPLYALGDGQWNIPELRKRLEKIVPEHAVLEGYEVEQEFPAIGRRIMLLNARKVFYEGNSHTSLLLAIEDVTDRRGLEREMKDLLQQKDVLLQEMQHRVANSLQIIASILLLKARTVESEETRAHLQEVPSRSWLELVAVVSGKQMIYDQAARSTG